jgi:carboxypeptidase C (cathepsin A)
MRSSLVILLLLLFSSQTQAQSPEKPKPPGEITRSPEKDEGPPAVTQHEITVNGKPLKYTASAGTLPIRDAKGEVEARIFYVAYTLDDVPDKSKRPLMFSFNGGPGSASVWLHLGALGPRRVDMPSDAKFARPPFKLVDNESTWLDATDLVFIDPVGTGFSRAAKPELNAKFHGLKGDIESVGEFIRLYLTREDRWNSPLYLVGESYGTTRAAGLSDYLVEKGIALNGIALVSSVLDFQTLQFDRGNDLPYVLYVPTYAATA